jgi:ferritin-like metal-binding protein YciE
MPTSTIDEQLTQYLTDAHSIEEQALQQLRLAPRMAGDPELATAFREHLVETERHERLVRERLEARDAKPSRFKDAAMRAGGLGFLLFARTQPDTPGKLAAHAYSFEHLEIAAYELLARVASVAGDRETADVARRIQEDERRMADRLAGAFERAAEASLRALGAAALGERLVKYLADAHALEAQAIELLERAPQIGGDPELERVYREHLEETRAHQRLVRERLEAHGSGPSALKDAAMRLGALNWGMFFQAHPDTPGKLAAFAFGFEHLEIAGYEELKRVAQRAGDEATVEVADRILAQERAVADKIAAAFGRAADASLRSQGVAA